jgi:hypothetical protein
MLILAIDLIMARGTQRSVADPRRGTVRNEAWPRLKSIRAPLFQWQQGASDIGCAYQS